MKDLSATLFWARTDQAAMELYTRQIHGQQFRQQHMDWGAAFHKTCMNVVSRPMLNIGGVVVVVVVLMSSLTCQVLYAYYITSLYIMLYYIMLCYNMVLYYVTSIPAVASEAAPLI